MTEHSENEGNVYPLPLGDIPYLEIHAEAAAIRLLPLEAGGTPRIVVGAPWMGAEIERRDESVIVTLKPKDPSPMSFFWPLFGRGWTWATVYLPEEAHAIVRSDFGRVEARDLHVNELEVSSQAGSIDLFHVKGRLRLSAQAGRIRGVGLAGAIEAETQAGAIQLDIDALAPGVHRAQSQVGAVRISLAEGIAVRIEGHTELGKVRVRYPSTDDATTILRLSTEMGAVEVRGKDGHEHDEHRGSEHHHRHRHHERSERRAQWSAHFGDWHAGSRPPPPEAPGPEFRKVLDLVAAGKITPGDAEALLRAMQR